MKVMVTGVNGQLGHDVMIHLHRQGIEGIGVDIQDFDLDLHGEKSFGRRSLNPAKLLEG